MDQILIGATLLALAFWLFQVMKGKRDARRKQQKLDQSPHAPAIPKEVIAQLRQQAPPSPPPPPSRKRKKP